jgi:helix-turn-helix protein
MIAFNKRAMDRIVSGYKNGQTLRELADKHDVSVAVIRRVLAERKVKIRPRGPQPVA